jgi:adenylate cyclase
MNEQLFSELSAWVTQAGLTGTPETDIVSEFCSRCVAAGLPLARSMMFIDTLHPVHEGQLFRWGVSPTEASLLEYGRTSPDALAASGSNPQIWRPRSAGDAVPISGCYKLASRFSAAA